MAPPLGAAWLVPVLVGRRRSPGLGEPPPVLRPGTLRGGRLVAASGQRRRRRPGGGRAGLGERAGPRAFGAGACPLDACDRVAPRRNRPAGPVLPPLPLRHAAVWRLVRRGGARPAGAADSGDGWLSPHLRRGHQRAGALSLPGGAFVPPVRRQRPEHSPRERPAGRRRRPGRLSRRAGALRPARRAAAGVLPRRLQLGGDLQPVRHVRHDQHAVLHAAHGWIAAARACAPSAPWTLRWPAWRWGWGWRSIRPFGCSCRWLGCSWSRRWSSGDGARGGCRVHVSGLAWSFSSWWRRPLRRRWGCSPTSTPTSSGRASRTRSSSQTRPRRSAGRPWWTTCAAIVLMFNWRGDPNGRHNLPGNPMLDAVSAGLLVLGLAYAIRRIADPRYLLLLLWLFVGLLGGILSLDFEAPQSLRSNVTLAAVMRWPSCRWPCCCGRGTWGPGAISALRVGAAWGS